MPKPFVSNAWPRLTLRRRACLGTLAFAAWAAPLGTIAGYANAASLGVPTFEDAFAVNSEPAAIYYKVSFAGRDGNHTLQVWRDGQSKLRRRTDDAIDTYVLRAASDPGEYQMVVVDYKKRITTRISRNNLIRLGHFSDWFDLAHGLRHPVGPYKLSVSQAPAGAPAPVEKCRWYDLRQGEAIDSICWSDRDRLPLVIWSREKGALWRVAEVVRGPLPGDTFALHDAGFVRNDANDDINND
jgi:hypothetical protein